MRGKGVTESEGGKMKKREIKKIRTTRSFLHPSRMIRSNMRGGLARKPSKEVRLRG